MSYFFIKNVDTKLVLEVIQGHNEAMLSIIMNSFNGSDTQLWSYKENHAICSKFRNGEHLDVNLGNYLTVRSSTDKITQRWYFEEDFVKNGNGLYMDVDQANRNVGAKVMVYEKHGGRNQQFRTVPVCLESSRNKGEF